MKYIILTVSLLLFAINCIQAQTESEARASFPKIININSSEVYDYAPLPFINVNITNQSAPQNEPSVRISRLNPSYIVAAWRDFRLGFTNPIVRRIGYSRSTDGGNTWAPPQLLPDPNPEHTSQSDPVVISDENSNFYISSTSRKQDTFPENRDMLIYRSVDTGQTFVLYSTAVPGTGGAGEDKEWIFCNLVPGSPAYNNIFITWTSFGNISTGIKFRRSSNGGLNWSSTVNVSDNSSGQGSCSASGTNGEIYVVWSYNGTRFDKSTNSGQSFGTDYALSSYSNTNGFPFVCVDYSAHTSRGNVYIVWDDTRSGNSDVWFQRSTDSGQNWLTAPVRVNDAATNNQYWPCIQCDTSGVLYVIYYDTRFQSTAINSFLAYSTDAGSTWTNQRLSDSSFSGALPNSEVRFGDYIQVDAFANKVIPVWTDDRAGTPNQEIYTAKVQNLISVENISSGIPRSFKLYQNYPNPFNPSTKIKFDLPSSVDQYYYHVKLEVYDVLGKRVAVLLDKQLRSGSYEFEWDSEALPNLLLTSGIYFYRLSAGEYISTRKMIIIK
jgi:hypothetical protein